MTATTVSIAHTVTPPYPADGAAVSLQCAQLRHTMAHVAAAAVPPVTPKAQPASPSQTSETRSASVEHFDDLCKEFRLQVQDMVISDQSSRRTPQIATAMELGSASEGIQ